MLPSGFFNMDCMDAMREFPDKFFDLALIDPPYRDSSENQPTKDMRRNGSMDSFGDKPTQEYFDELFRVSKNQIIWGANNFQLPSYKGFVVWKKLTISDNFTMSMAELAFISEGLGTTSKIFEYAPQGTKNEPRLHPCQKPIALYLWLLQNYAKRGDKILDTHVGSASSLIACHRMGFEYWGMELDADYFQAASERLEKEKSMQPLFSPEEIYKPQQQGLDFGDKE